MAPTASIFQTAAIATGTLLKSLHRYVVKPQDRLFLFGLGLTTAVTIRCMRQMLIHYRDAAIIPRSDDKSQYITQNVEDSLKLSTLNKLLNSPNYSIQETTSVIICERALHDRTTIDILLYHITRPDYDTRERGIRALMMIINSCKLNLTVSHCMLTF
jgi:hypothetical protein